MDKESFLKKIDRIENIPTLPAIAMEVNSMLQDYNTSIKTLSDIIEKDQAIVSKILKLVNSAFFGVRSKISNIPHAITLLGFNTVRNAIVSVSIIDAISLDREIPGFDIKDFWRHSVAAAVTSKYIAEKTQLHIPNDCFIGGLLHDIGKIVLSQHFPEIFIKIIKACQNNRMSFYEIEKNETPVDHARIGGHLAKKWQLPVGLIDAIQYHHTVNKNSHDPNFVMIISAADIIVNSMADATANIKLSAVNPEVKKAAHGILYTVSDWFPAVLEEIESACNFFLEDLKNE